jgi:N6-L-threonylcarbamoyladenine synthase
MFDKGEPQEDIAKFALSYITASLDKMLELIMQEYGNMPVLFSGGVSSNSMIKKTISEKYGAYFADSEFACDNAVGIAIYAYLKSKKL